MAATRLRLHHAWLTPSHLPGSNTPGWLHQICRAPTRLADTNAPGWLQYIWLAPTQLSGSNTSGWLQHIWLTPTRLAGSCTSAGLQHAWLTPAADVGTRYRAPGWHASRRRPAFACPVPHPSRISSSLLLLPQMRTSTLLRNPYHPQQRLRRGEPLASSPQPCAVAGEPAFASLRCLPKNNNDLFPSL